MTRYFLEVMYDGTRFHGSQLQGDTETVQLAVNKTLNTLLRSDIITFGASRTDEGVHALSNFYHFDFEGILPPSFQYQFNAVLPEGIALTQLWRPIDQTMNARFQAETRSYRYRIYAKKNPFLSERAFYFPYRLDEQVLHETASILKKYIDFESFSKRNTQSRTFKCTIHQASWERQGDELHFTVTANRFLRGMVRGLVGTQLRIARSGQKADALRTILEARDCSKADFSVPGHGLYLEKVTYPIGSLEPVYDARQR